MVSTPKRLKAKPHLLLQASRPFPVGVIPFSVEGEIAIASDYSGFLFSTSDPDPDDMKHILVGCGSA